MPRPGSEEVLEAGLVLTSVGYRGVAVPGVPFDEASATIPHREGRVLDSPGGREVAGLYVVGWIKRGPRGFIGSNKTCARETVNALLEDANAGRLPTPSSSSSAFDALLSGRSAPRGRTAAPSTRSARRGSPWAAAARTPSAGR